MPAEQQPGPPATSAEEAELWMRYARGSSWAELGWLPPVAGHPRSGEVDPDALSKAFDDLWVPDHAVPGICPWPDAAAVSRAIAGGQLLVIGRPGVYQVTITPAARDALTRDPAGRGRMFTPERALLMEADRAGKHATLTQFAAYLRTEHRRITALAVMRPQRPGRDVIITLWEQVRDAARAADKAARAWYQAELEAGRDPFDGP